MRIVQAWSMRENRLKSSPSLINLDLLLFFTNVHIILNTQIQSYIGYTSQTQPQTRTNHPWTLFFTLVIHNISYVSIPQLPASVITSVETVTLFLSLTGFRAFKFSSLILEPPINLHYLT